MVSRSLEYASDGVHFTLLSALDDDDSQYDWSVPSVDLTGARLRLTVTDEYGKTVTTTSNAFGIDSTAPSISLTAPNGGESVMATTPVTWSASDAHLGSTSITLQYSTDGGSTWVPIASGIANSGSYSWHPASLKSTSIQIRAIAVDLAGNSSSDDSDAVFTVDTVPQGKNIRGTPGAMVTISFSGTASDLRLKFRDVNTAKIVYGTSVAADGSITLPSKAGVYTTELQNTANHSVSYGQATVTNAISGWTSTQTQSLGSYAPYRVWPDSTRAIGDYTGDGFPDLAFAEGTTTGGTSQAPGIYLYTYDSVTSKYVFDQRMLSTESFIFGMRFVDIDGDGALDLVYGRSNPTTYSADLCYMMNSSGTFGAPTCLTDSTATSTNRSFVYQLAVADLDRDGFPDVVAAGGRMNGSSWIETRAVVYHNTGSGLAVSEVLEESASLRFTDLKIADMNDDGLLDIVALTGDNSGSAQIYVYPQASDGTFDTATVRKTGCSGTGFFTVGYLNSDTKPDIVAIAQANASGHYLQSNASDDTLAVSSIAGPTEQHASISSVADLNLDGTPEVYFGPRNRILYNNKIGIFFRTAATLGSSISVNASNSIEGATSISNYMEVGYDFADLNQDGKIDVLMFSVYNSPFFETVEGN